MRVAHQRPRKTFCTCALAPTYPHTHTHTHAYTHTHTHIHTHTHDIAVGAGACGHGRCQASRRMCTEAAFVTDFFLFPCCSGRKRVGVGRRLGRYKDLQKR